MRTLLFLTIAAALPAHDLYLRPQQFRLAAGASGVVEFHNGEAFPRSQVPPVLARLRGARVIGPQGSDEVRGIRVVGTAATGAFRAPSASAFLIAAHTVPNFIELAPAKFEEYLKHEHLDSILEWRKKAGESGKPGRELYSKYVKTILHTGAPDSFVTKALGEVIEFVPAADPASVKVGGKLTVRLLYHGAPAAGIHVEAASANGTSIKERQLGRTDSQGRIEIPIDVPGLWKLHAIHMARHDKSSEADWESFWASLTFEVNP